MALALTLGAAAQEIRLGNEFQVNVYTTDYQQGQSLAVDADGDFIVAWTSNGQDGSETGIFARRFSSAGAPLVWQSYEQDGEFGGIFAQRFSSVGAPVATEFQVTTKSPPAAAATDEKDWVPGSSSCGR